MYEKENVISTCENAVREWVADSTIVFHPISFGDALAIRQYMEHFYSYINIFIVCNGFVYGTELKNMGK